jgi:hypothetical protein
VKKLTQDATSAPSVLVFTITLPTAGTEPSNSSRSRQSLYPRSGRIEIAALLMNVLRAHLLKLSCRHARRDEVGMREMTCQRPFQIFDRCHEPRRRPSTLPHVLGSQAWALSTLLRLREVPKGKILTSRPSNKHCITSRMGGPWTHSHGQGWRVLFDSTSLRGTRKNPNLCVPTETRNNRYRHSLDQFPTDASQCEIPYPGLCCFQTTDQTVVAVARADRPLRCVLWQE